MAPRKTAHAAKKKRDQAELKNINAIQITIEASELNLQRLGALLMFADPYTDVKLVKALGPLPWEEKGESPPQLEIDRVAVQNAVTPLLVKYVDTHGHDSTRILIESFGGPKLRDLSDEQILGLYNALAGEAASD